MKIDPLKRKCICGYYWHFNKWDYVKMVIFGSLIYSCPQCHRKHEYKLIYHAIEEYDNVKSDNNLLNEGKMSIWRKG